MKLFERVLFVVVGLILIIVISILFIVPDSLAAVFLGLAEINTVIRLGLALVLNALVLGAMYLRLRPRPAGDAAGLVVKAQGAVADVSVESAREMILKAVNQVPGVTKADARVQALRGKADIELDVTVMDASINVPNKQKEINRALKQVVSKQLGLNIAGRPRVHIHLGDKAAFGGTTGAAALPSPSTTKPAIQPTEPEVPADDKPEAEPEKKSSGMFLRKGREAAPADAEDKPAESVEKAATDEATWLNSYLGGSGAAQTEREEEQDKGQS